MHMAATHFLCTQGRARPSAAHASTSAPDGASRGPAEVVVETAGGETVLSMSHERVGKTADAMVGAIVGGPAGEITDVLGGRHASGKAGVLVDEHASKKVGVLVDEHASKKVDVPVAERVGKVAGNLGGATSGTLVSETEGFGVARNVATMASAGNGGIYKLLHVVLDLDGTLITQAVSPYAVHVPEPDMVMWIGDSPLFAFHRPGTVRFLSQCFLHFASVSIWTAASEGWLAAFLQSVPAHMQRMFSFTWCARECCCVNGNLYKPLKTMWATPHAQALGMCSTNTLIVDDTPEVCSDNLLHLVRVPTCHAVDRDDRTLSVVVNLLRRRNEHLARAFTERDVVSV